MHLSVVRRAFVSASFTSALSLGLTVPAHAAGTNVQIKKLGTVNVREAAAAAKHAPYRPANRNLPASAQFAALEERRFGEEAALRKSAPTLKPPSISGALSVSSRSLTSS